jgi:hypothetical protein
MKIIKIYILVLFALSTPITYAQTDMVMIRPIDFSPGMVGNKETCISLSSQNINFSSELNSHNTSLSYEFLSQKLKGGIGISYTSSLTNFKNPDTFIFGKNSSQRLNIVYAPKIVYRKNLQFSPFIKMSAMHINNDAWRNVFEADIRQLPIEHGEKYNVASTSVGFLVNQRRWFFGAETYGANTLLIDTLSLAHSMGFKYQMGVFFNFTKSRKYGISLILANDWANDEGRLYNANNSIISVLKLSKVNVLFSYHSDYFGTINQSSVRLGLGYQPSKKLKIGYSIRIPKDNWLNNFDHQIGIQYIIKKKDAAFFAG